MSKQKGILQTNTFYCDHLSMADVVDIENFSVRKPEIASGLALYLKEQALFDEQTGTMRTYLVRDMDTDKLVGYFSLKSGMVSINEREITNSDGSTSITFDTIPGIEVANFLILRNLKSAILSCNLLNLLCSLKNKYLTLLPVM